MVDPKRAEQILEAKKYRERAGKLMRVEFDKPLWDYINSPAQAAYLRGPNSGGKSYAQAFFVAQILLGRYHPTYVGWKPNLVANDSFDVVAWVLSKSSQVLRDAMQTHLLGDVAGGRIGEGLIPKENIVNVQMGRGIGGSVDFAIIKRDNGKMAKVSFKSYEQGREMLQGERVTLVACDEMFDDVGMLSELLARGAGIDGIFRLSATERMQQSAVAQWFYSEPGPNRKVYGFGMDDVTRISAEERARIKASYPPNEVDSRYHGLPFRGGGGVFHADIEDIIEDIDPAKFGPQVRYFISIDPSHFGQSSQASKFAALYWAHDPLVPNEWVIFQEILMRGGVNDQVAALLAAGAHDIPIAWPADGHQGMATGNSLAKLFSTFPGIRMHSTHATFNMDPKGGYNLEDRISLCNKMLSAHQIIVSKSCRNFIAQYQSLERDEETNKPMIEKLDVMSCFTIGIMALKIARVGLEHRERQSNNYLDDPRGKWDIFTGEGIGSQEGLVNDIISRRAR